MGVVVWRCLALLMMVDGCAAPYPSHTDMDREMALFARSTPLLKPKSRRGLRGTTDSLFLVCASTTSLTIIFSPVLFSFCSLFL